MCDNKLALNYAPQTIKAITQWSLGNYVEGKKRGSHTKLTGKLSRAGAMNERMDTVVFHLQIKAEEEAPNPRFLTREDTTSINHKVLRVLSVQ